MSALPGSQKQYSTTLFVNYLPVFYLLLMQAQVLALLSRFVCSNYVKSSERDEIRENNL